MPLGRELIAEMDSFAPDCGERFAFWWLGQQGYALKVATGGAPAVIYIDAYLSGSASRTVAPVVAPDEVTNATLVLGSHDHGDHIDRDAWPRIAAASPEAIFVVPESCRQKVAADLEIPEGRMVGLVDGQSAELAGVTVTAVASAHELRECDEDGRDRYLGYVIEAEGAAIYHAGDTCRYEGLVGKLARWSFDLALLPINGRDARRLAANCIGNMTYQEAVDLAGELSPGLTVPGHYEMFEMNSEDPELFLSYMAVKYPDLKAIAPAHGEMIAVR